MLLAVACSPHGASVAAPPASSGAATGLIGSEWVLEDLGVGGVHPTISFSEDGRVAGNASCNHFSGSVTLKADAMTFGALMTTRMACGEDLDRQEAAYLKALAAAERYRREGESLLIFCKGIEKPLTFKRA